MDETIYKKIVQKKEFSELPKIDVEKAFAKFERRQTSDEDRIKLTRDLLRKTFSGFAGQRMLNWKNKTAEEILQKHLSTRERFDFYEEIYARLLKNMPKKISVIDLGCGVNGVNYKLFEKVGKQVDYFGVESVGQLTDLTNDFFETNKIKNAVVINESLFNLEKIKKLILQTKKPKVVFMFKVVDALESLERDYTKSFLKEIVPLVDRVVVSFATQSWFSRKKFFVKRTWLTSFIKENFEVYDNFEFGGEKYIVFSK